MSTAPSANDYQLFGAAHELSLTGSRPPPMFGFQQLHKNLQSAWSRQISSSSPVPSPPPLFTTLSPFHRVSPIPLPSIIDTDTDTGIGSDDGLLLNSTSFNDAENDDWKMKFPCRFGAIGSERRAVRRPKMAAQLSAAKWSSSSRSIGPATNNPPQSRPASNHPTIRRSVGNVSAADDYHTMSSSPSSQYSPAAPFAYDYSAAATAATELYVSRIPNVMHRDQLQLLFNRFGSIRSIRLVHQFQHDCRSYGYVQFDDRRAAERALYVLPECYVMPHRRLRVALTAQRRRLRVWRVPRYFPATMVADELRVLFGDDGVTVEVLVPEVAEVEGGGGNRGVAFVEFRSHAQALLVKQRTAAGRLRLFGETQLRVAWTNGQGGRDDGDGDAVGEDVRMRTLWLKNVQLSLAVDGWRMVDVLEMVARYVDPKDVRAIRMCCAVDGGWYVELRNRRVAGELRRMLKEVEVGVVEVRRRSPSSG